jgi:AraC family transcriptional regulator
MAPIQARFASVPFGYRLGEHPEPIGRIVLPILPEDRPSLSVIPFGRIHPPAVPINGSLAPWQERRAKEIMRSRFAARLTIADVACECRLTPRYFAKAFRRATGMSPHRYLTDLRVQEARSLLLSSSLPLADIALICGFGDQSYFTRVFTRSVGVSPGAWRRSMQNGRP